MRGTGEITEYPTMNPSGSSPKNQNIHLPIGKGNVSALMEAPQQEAFTFQLLGPPSDPPVPQTENLRNVLKRSFEWRDGELFVIVSTERFPAVRARVEGVTNHFFILERNRSLPEEVGASMALPFSDESKLVFRGTALEKKTNQHGSHSYFYGIGRLTGGNIQNHERTVEICASVYDRGEETFHDGLTKMLEAYLRAHAQTCGRNGNQDVALSDPKYFHKGVVGWLNSHEYMAAKHGKMIPCIAVEKVVKLPKTETRKTVASMVVPVCMITFDPWSFRFEKGLRGWDVLNRMHVRTYDLHEFALLLLITTGKNNCFEAMSRREVRPVLDALALLPDNILDPDAKSLISAFAGADVGRRTEAVERCLETMHREKMTLIMLACAGDSESVLDGIDQCLVASICRGVPADTHVGAAMPTGLSTHPWG